MSPLPDSQNFLDYLGYENSQKQTKANQKKHV